MQRFPHTERPPALGRGRRWAVFTICAVAMLLVGIDTTIVSVALPRMGIQLDIERANLAWVVDAYTVPFASLLISGGTLGDRFGRRRLLKLGFVVFGAASIACALAPNFALLLAARALQGVGASMLTPIALAIVVNTLRDPRERATALGLWGAIFGISVAAGPLLGGLLLTAFDWRAVFWFGAPLAFTAWLLVSCLVPESRNPRPRRLDGAGQVWWAVLLSATVTAVISIAREDDGPIVALTAFLTALGAWGALIRVESRRADPLIDPFLFTHRPFTTAIMSAVLLFAAFGTSLVLSTVLAQHVLGWSPMLTGWATLPLAFGVLVGAPLSGFAIGRTGARTPLIVAGLSVCAGGAVWSGVTWLSASALVPAPALPAALLGSALCVGFGIGVSSPAITTSAVNSLPVERAGLAGGTTSTARQVGIALGAALAGVLLAGVPAEVTTQPDVSGDALLPLLPGWIVVACCGLATSLLAFGTRSAGSRRSDQPPDPSVTTPAIHPTPERNPQS